MDQGAAETSSMFQSGLPSTPEYDTPEPLVHLEASAAELVGLSGVDVAQARVKCAMLREALARTGGNFTKTASLLGVRRQAIQQMVARFDLRAWANEVRRAAPTPQAPERARRPAVDVLTAL